jgi:predicted metal-dependent peptidase
MNALPDSVDKLFDITKGKLFFEKCAGFFGPLLCQLEFHWTRDIKTAAISATTLYWNPDFFLSIDPKTRVTVLAHEIKHNADLDGARMGNRDPEIWNHAADHAINLFLKEHGYYMDGFPYLMDPKYKGWAREDIYDDLVKQQKKGNKPFPPNPLGNDIRKISPEELPAAIATVAAAVQTARMSGKPGSIPGDTLVTLDKFLFPKLPWNVILFNYFNALVQDDRSYMRPSRRHEEIIMPGNMGRSGLEHLVYALDLSGSTTDEMVNQSNNEVRHIQEDLMPERLTMVTFDTKIIDEFHFERGDSYPPLKVHGRGGTALEPVYAYAKKHEATALIILTDLLVRIPPDPGIPVVFVCVDNPSASVPYGVVVHMDTTTGSTPI